MTTASTVLLRTAPCFHDNEIQRYTGSLIIIWLKNSDAWKRLELLTYKSYHILRSAICCVQFTRTESINFLIHISFGCINGFNRYGWSYSIYISEPRRRIASIYNSRTCYAYNSATDGNTGVERL